MGDLNLRGLNTRRAWLDLCCWRRSQGSFRCGCNRNGWGWSLSDYRVRLGIDELFAPIVACGEPLFDRLWRVMSAFLKCNHGMVGRNQPVIGNREGHCVHVVLLLVVEPHDVPLHVRIQKFHDVGARGEHHAGIATPAQDRLVFAAFDVTLPERAELRDLFREWSRAAELMTAGQPVGPVGRDESMPPVDTGEAGGVGPRIVLRRTLAVPRVEAGPETVLPRSGGAAA